MISFKIQNFILNLVLHKSTGIYSSNETVKNLIEKNLQHMKNEISLDNTCNNFNSLNCSEADPMLQSDCVMVPYSVNATELLGQL